MTIGNDEAEELRVLRAFAAQMLGMGAAYRFDTTKNSHYCLLCDAWVDIYMEGPHAPDCLVPIVEEMPITSDGDRLEDQQ